jgi:hypothetical protein
MDLLRSALRALEGDPADGHLLILRCDRHRPGAALCALNQQLIGRRFLHVHRTVKAAASSQVGIVVEERRQLTCIDHCGLTGGAAMQKPTEEQIRARAHELWEQAGKPQGREDELWLLAEKDLSERSREQPESKIAPG